MNIDKLKEKVMILPNVFKFIKEEVKDNFEEHGKEILDTSSGLSGIIIKLFAKDAIDSYFSKKEAEKLADDGSDVFLKASFEQVEKSISYIKDKLPKSDTSELINYYFDVALFSYENTFLDKKIIEIDKSFDINYLHSYPSIIFARDIVEEILRNLEMNTDLIDEFISHFNKHITETIFDDLTKEEYSSLLTKININKTENNELKFLQDMERLNRIGFKSNENLKYISPYVSWKHTSEYRKNENIDDLTYEEIDELEKTLQPIDELIHQYFDSYKTELTMKKILFIISDFGKGKSTFLKNYGSELASKYLRRGKSEYFPVYFNLNVFNDKSYNPNHALGIIASYLSIDYGIKIESDYYKDRKFIFLIDSLDESGDLDKTSIDNVISSIKKIQSLNEIDCRKNRIIMTSRPIDNILLEHLDGHTPYTQKDSNSDSINMYISIHGFKSVQFNEWMKASIESSDPEDLSSLTGFSKELVEKITSDEDIYEFILENNLLKSSELQRPIFSYMIYKLILSNIDFSSIEKIGIYLSFLNILTKDAKHVSDINSSINLADEFNFRNILHYIAVLWLKQKEINDSSTLTRSDICKTIKGKIPDDETIEHCQDIKDLKFLSHSYFGNDGDTLYFNHQSFAEMLIAEYYLKVFIKHALDGGDNSIENTRILLSIGTPTEQTMIFFKELLLLFKESANNDDPYVDKKREMLVKFVASCSVKKNNRIICTNLYNRWYEDYEEDFINKKDKTKELIKSWPITDKVIDKISQLAKDIIISENTICFTKARQENSVFNNEIIIFQKDLSSVVPDIDKWIALIVGNTLKTNIVADYDRCEFFNANFSDYTQLFQMIKNWNSHVRSSAPVWCRDLFQGLIMDDNHYYNLEYLHLGNLNFSYSKLFNIDFSSSTLHHTRFNYCHFKNIKMEYANIYGSRFNNIQHLNNLNFYRCNIIAGILFPTTINNSLIEKGNMYFLENDIILKELISLSDIKAILNGIFKYGIKNKLFDKKLLLNSFQFKEQKTQNEYKKFINSLEE